MQARRRNLGSDEGGMEQTLHQDVLHLQRMALLYKRRGLMEQAAAVYETLHQLGEEAQAADEASSAREQASQVISQASEPRVDPQADATVSSESGANVADTNSSLEPPNDKPKPGGRFVRLK